MSQVSGLRLIQTAHTPLLRRLVPATGGNDWTVNDVLPAILRTLSAAHLSLTTSKAFLNPSHTRYNG
jgi:hypothetical protein